MRSQLKQKKNREIAICTRGGVIQYLARAAHWISLTSMWDLLLETFRNSGRGREAALCIGAGLAESPRFHCYPDTTPQGRFGGLEGAEVGGGWKGVGVLAPS